GLDSKLTGFQTASKDLDNLLEIQRLDKNKEGLGYSDVPPPPAQIYSLPKKDMSWTGLPKFKDDVVTDYSRPAPTIESSPDDAQKRNTSVTETEASPSAISPKSFIKFVKANDSPNNSKTDKAETTKKPHVKYAEQYRKPTKKPNVRGNQRNWNNLKSHQLGPNFVIKKNACFNYGDFNHLAYDCRKRGSSQNNFDDKGYWDSRCSRHMIGNISYLSDYEPFDGGHVSFGQGGCKITGKGTIKTGKLDFENVYFVKDLKYNLFSVSQICDNKNSVLFTDSECIVLGHSFKLSDDDNVLLRTPRQYNMYLIDLNNIVPHKDRTCLVANASADECMLWHMRLAKDETSGILRKFITEIENLKDLKVKIIRCDNGGEFRNKEMNDVCSQKVIKREFINARTPQQNGVAERRNGTLIEEARTMLADAKLPVTFLAEAVNSACNVQNRVLVNKSQNKTPYELFNGRTPTIGFFKPFGYHVMILNTLDNLGKFEAKGDEEFLENKAIEKGAGPNWLFDIDSLTKSMNYVPVDAGTNSINLLGTKDAASEEVKKDVSSLRYIALPNWVHYALLESSSSKPQDDCSTDVPKTSRNSNPTATSTNPLDDQLETLTLETPVPTVSSPVPTACITDSPYPSSNTRLISKRVANQVETPSLDNILTLTNRFEDILRVTTNSDESSKVEADTLVNCPKGVRPIGTKCVLKNKKDERGIVIRDKARLVAQGRTQEEGINYDEMDVKSAFLYGTINDEVYVMQPPGFQDPKFPTKVYKVEKGMYGLHQAPRAWYGTLSKYLLTNGFQRGTIDQTIFIRREFEALIHEKFQMGDMGELNFFLGLQVLHKNGIFLSQDKYVGDILKKFEYSDVRSSNTPMDKENPWGKDRTKKDVDLHLYRSMIGSLMYLTASRLYIMFVVCACARHQVTPKECHLHTVKRIFRYLKGHPKLGLWYPKESLFDLVAYSDSDYGGATQDCKSTTRGCQFLGRRLISWQCRKQTIVATSTTEAEYVTAANCCGQVLWIQNQLLDYGRFGIKGKLSPRFIGPFEILDRVGEVSYCLALPPQLLHVHEVFHVSLLRGYKYHPLNVITYPLDQIRIDLS
nr:putative ribonuclease H-like domain-containing protein [Tanacetum cinerariifolium]